MKKNKNVVTIYDVAREADVSLATVSRVLNNSAVVREEKKKRVQEAIKKLKFKPNEIARGLARKATTTIGVIVPDTSRLVVSELLSGIIDTANLKQYNYTILVNSYVGDEVKFAEQLERFTAAQVDGVLIMCDFFTQKMQMALQEATIPVISFASQTPKGITQASITVDYQAAAATACQYFITNGYQELLFLTRSEQLDSDPLYKGIATVYKNEKIKTLTLKEHYAKNYEVLKAYLKKNILPKAVFVADDELAIVLTNLALDMNIQIPTDLELISFADTEVALMSRPQVTSIMYPVYKVGAYAMSTMKKCIKNEKIDDVNLNDEFEIIWRGTTKK